MGLAHWTKIIKRWVNSLNLVEHPISSISDISDGVFLTNFLKKLYNGLNKCEHKDWEDTPAQNIINGYLENEFEEYFNEAHLNLESDEELLCLTSLFLFASCIKHDMHWAKSPLCRLENSMQLEVKRFMETMLNTKYYTRSIVKNAITEITEDEETPVKSDFESPCNRLTETPKLTRTMLKDFFDSPLAQKRILAEKVKQNNKLIRQLLQEQSENADLQELVQSLQKELSAQKAIIEKKSIQINTLKLELVEKSESCGQSENSDCTVKERLLKNEIKDLKVYVNRMESDIISIKDELKNATYKLQCAENWNNMLRSQCAEIEKYYEVSQENVRKLEEMLNQTQKICKDQGDYIQTLEKQRIADVNMESPVHFNFTSPEDFCVSSEENLGKTVVDIVLQEKENEMILLKEKINVLVTEANDKNLKILSQQQMIEVQELALNKLENEKTCITESFKSMQNEVESFKKEIMAKELIINGLYDENEQLKSEQHQLREDMKVKLHEISGLKSINKELEQSVSDNVRKVRDSEEQINLLKVFIDTITQEVTNTISHVVKHSLTFKKDIDTKIYNLSEYILKSDVHIVKVNNISDKIEKLKISMAKSSMKLIKAQEENETLKDELQSRTSDINNLKEEIKKNYLIVQRAEIENKNMKVKHESLMKDINIKLMEISELKENKLKLETELTCTNEKLLFAEKQISLIKDELSKTETELSNITLEKVEVTKKLTEEVNLVSKELHETQHQVECITSKKEELESNLHNQIIINNNLSKEIVDLKVCCERLSNSRAALETELRNKISILVSEKNDVTSKLNDSVNQLDWEQQEVKRLNSEIEKIQSELTNELNNAKKEYTIIEGEINAKTEQLKSLQKELINKDLNIKKLKGEYETLRDEKDAVLEKLTDSYNKNAEQEEKIKKLSSEIESTAEGKLQSNIKLNELEKEIVIVTEKFHEKCNKLERLTEELRNKELVISNLENENKSLLLSQNNMLSDKEAKEKEILELKESKRNLKDKLNNRKEKVVMLEQKIQELQNNLDNTLAKIGTISSQYEDKFKNLTNEINLLSGRLEDTLLINNNISSEKADLEKELAFKNNHLSQLSNEISTLKYEKIHLEQQLVDKGEEITVMSNEICTLKSEKEGMKNLVTDKNREISVMASTLCKLQTEKITLENNLVSKDSQICGLKNEISALKLEKIGSLEKKLNEKELELAGLASEISQLRTQKMNLEEELAHKSSEVSVLRNDILDLQSNYQLSIYKENSKEEIIKALQSQIDTLTTEKNDLTCVLNGQNKTVTELEQKIKLLNYDIEVAKSIQSDSNIKLYNLEKDNVRRATECNSKVSEIKCLKAELEQKALMISKAENENKILRKEKDLILNEIKVLKESKTYIENDLKINSKKRTEVEQKAEKLQQNLDKLTFEIRKLSVENVEVTKKLKETVSKLAETELERNTLTAKIFLNDTKINELSDLCNEYKDKIKTLEAKKEELCTDYKDVKSKYDVLKQEMTLIKNENKILLSNTRQLRVALDEANNKIKVQNNKIAEGDMLKEAYAKLVEENDSLQEEYKQLNDRLQDTLKEKKQIAEKSASDLQKLRNQIRNDYELKLQYAKSNVKAVYSSQKIKIEEQKTKELQQYKDKIQRDQDHIAELSSQLRNTNDRVLALKQENEELKSTIQFLRSQSYEIQDRRRTLSVDQICLPSRMKGNAEVLEIIDETITQTHRVSTHLVPYGTGKVYPSEDEQGEVFDNTCLADLKAGRCIVDDNSDRISTLQYRNSLCPPHLKSSYPAETQFLATEKIKEDEIKGEPMTSNKENLLPGEKTRKKDKNQVSFKKPSAPTSSKYGGRRYLQSITEGFHSGTPGSILRENNSESQRSQASTPAQIKALFAGRHNDENVPTTPKSRKSPFLQKHCGTKE